MALTADVRNWHRRGREIECLAQRLFVVDEGDAQRPALLLIHGFPTAGWDWHSLWPLLLPHFRLVAPDLLGFGLSPKPPDHDYSLLEQADLVEALMNRLRVPRYHILAHDYGDSVAQELLARDSERDTPGRLLSVALLNGGLFPETHRPRLIQRILLSPVGGLVARHVSRATLARNMRSIFGPDTPPSAGDIDAFWSLIRHNDGQRVFHRLIRYMPERRRHRERWVRALCHPPAPVLLINGSRDPVSGAHMVARYRQLAGDRDIVELPDIGHYPQIEAPAAVARHFLAWHRCAPDEA